MDSYYILRGAPEKEAEVESKLSTASGGVEDIYEDRTTNYWDYNYRSSTRTGLPVLLDLTSTRTPLSDLASGLACPHLLWLCELSSSALILKLSFL